MTINTKKVEKTVLTELNEISNRLISDGKKEHEAKNAAKVRLLASYKNCQTGFTPDRAEWLEYSHAIFFLSRMEFFAPLRVIKVYYSNGDTISTSMAAHLTNEQMTDYFKVGRVFNVGSGEHDIMAKVVKTEILK